MWLSSYRIGMLLQALCNPELSREEALSLGRAARRVDPMIDVALARSLADSAVDSAIRVADPARLMDILCEIADPGRIMPSLMRMMRHPNPYLRSKAVKMIGRGSKSTKWVMGRLSESDPRVRANAIESLWGVDTPEARTLLKFAASDANNRVAGERSARALPFGRSICAVGRGQPRGPRIHSVSRLGSVGYGETGDPRFTEALRRLISEPDTTVRKRAFAALAQIRVANGQPQAGEKLQ